MANTSRVRGLRPVQNMQADYQGPLEAVLIPSTDATPVFIGDAVKSSGTAGAAGVVVNGLDCEGMVTVIQAAAGDPIRGVVVGFLPKQTDLTVLHREASTNRIALIVSAPETIFEIEANGVGVAAVDIAGNADLTVGSGSTTTGTSAMALDSSTVSTTLTRQLRIIGIAKRADNAIGTADKVLVLINRHELYSPAGRVGI